MRVMLKYVFVFNPLETWRNRGDLDSDLAKFFRDKGLQLEKVRHENEETEFSERIIYVSKSPEVNPMPEKQKSVKQQVNKVRPVTRDESGRYLNGRPRRN